MLVGFQIGEQVVPLLACHIRDFFILIFLLEYAVNYMAWLNFSLLFTIRISCFMVVLTFPEDGREENEGSLELIVKEALELVS